MKTKFITTLFVLTAYFCFGQTSDKNSTNNISLGLIFSPDYCFRALIRKPQYSALQTIETRLKYRNLDLPQDSLCLLNPGIVFQLKLDCNIPTKVRKRL